MSQWTFSTGHPVLVASDSKLGSTQELIHRLAVTVGLPVEPVPELGGYEAIKLFTHQNVHTVSILVADSLFIDHRAFYDAIFSSPWLERQLLCQPHRAFQSQTNLLQQL